MKQVGLWTLSLAALLTAGGCEDSQVDVVATLGSMTVYDAVAPAPVTPDVGALYFSIRNSGDQPDRLTGVSVTVADSATLHTQTMEGATMHMTPLAYLTVPASGALRMVPGSDHVMITGIRQPYDVGDSLRVSAVLERSGVVTFSVPVVSYGDLAERFAEEFHLIGGRQP
jgi:copper(I)-binding protein